MPFSCLFPVPSQKLAGDPGMQTDFLSKGSDSTAVPAQPMLQVELVTVAASFQAPLGQLLKQDHLLNSFAAAQASVEMNPSPMLGHKRLHFATAPHHERRMYQLCTQIIGSREFAAPLPPSVDLSSNAHRTLSPSCGNGWQRWVQLSADLSRLGVSRFYFSSLGE